MKIFISWSGKDSISHKVATELSDWLPMVIQSVQPWISNDILSGDRWNEQINANLSEAEMGIICITPDNVNAPWLNFEAGAIAKGLSKNKVIPLLINMKLSDISNSPLTQFQATAFEHDNMRKLISDINNQCERRIEERNLHIIFDRLWPDLNQRIDLVISQNNKIAKPERRVDTAEVMEEVLKSLNELKFILFSRMDNYEDEQKRIRLSLNKDKMYNARIAALDEFSKRDDTIQLYINDMVNAGKLDKEIIDVISKRYNAPTSYITTLIRWSRDEVSNNNKDELHLKDIEAY